MSKEYTFTTEHYPVNDLLELDLEQHMNQMAEAGRELVSTQQLIREHSPTTPQMIFSGARIDELVSLPADDVRQGGH